MAAPASVNSHNLNGTFVMNKKLSDSSIPVLQMQSIPWLVQQAVKYSSIIIVLKQYTDAEGHVHVDQDQISTGGLRSMEERTLNGEFGEKNVPFWGQVRGQSRWVHEICPRFPRDAHFSSLVKVPEVEDEYLAKGWSDDCVAGHLVESYSESVGNGWTARQIWGFAEVDGMRRHVRRILAKKGDEALRIRLVYDWKS